MGKQVLAVSLKSITTTIASSRTALKRADVVWI
jgi:hypothetical protein